MLFIRWEMNHGFGECEQKNGDTFVEIANINTFISIKSLFIQVRQMREIHQKVY